MDSDISSDDDDIIHNKVIKPFKTKDGSRSNPNLLNMINKEMNLNEDDDKSIRSESERGQQDHEMSKHQFTKLIDEKMKSE